MTHNNKPSIIPLIQPSMPTLNEYTTEISSIWDTHIMTNMASKHQKLEQELKEYLSVQQFLLFVNGHIALECILEAMDLKGEVITSPFTFISTIHAIIRCGLKPVFCDIRPDDYTIDASKIEALITEKTVAILPIHVYGMVCQVDEIQRIADKHGLKVIYDSAHAFGVTVYGKGIGVFGDASMYSFHATKVYNTVEGGGATVQNEKLCEKLKIRRDFGITGPENVECVAGNGKLDEFRAAMGICNLRHVEEEIQKRKEATQWYEKRLGMVKGIKLLPGQEGVTKNYSYFPVVFEGEQFERDIIVNKLRMKGILTRKYFYPLCNDFACYREEYGNAEVPIARYVSDRILCLPMFAGITKEQVDCVCDAILM